MESHNRHMRAFILKRMREHQRPGSGSHWDPVRDREISTAQIAEWSWIGDEFGSIRYVIVGRLAVNQYAPPQYPIEGIELAVEPSDYEVATGIAEACQNRGKSVRVIPLREDWADEVLRYPHEAAGLPVMPIPYLLIWKMRCQQAEDIGDAQRILHGTGEIGRERTREIFLRYAPDDVSDLDELIKLSDVAW